MFITIETEAKDSLYETMRWFLAEDYIEEGGMNLKAGQELVVSHGDDTHAACEVVRDYQTFEDWQVKIPLNLIIERRYQVKLVNEKRLG